eukprot:gb/GECH01008536.1/.p1 GENE.gb/GECH01008536.1/~~gb/GECH01008536.1/.p1  ORF type:complete len:428 (+),score=109.33 gb/GECH01008536.1/:1-1284(+)
MPRVIGKYELGKTLGQGTFSKVKYGTDKDGEQAYAIKVVDRKQVLKENMEHQLKREIAIMKILKHQNVVDLVEVLQTKKHIYIILELVTGGELFDRIVKAKRFDEDTARRYFQQLILGLEYCHSQGIAHRDLKPENLLLDDKDTLKISDFGLSALSEGRDGQRRMLTTTCGTPNYVAPEVLEEKGYDGKMADVWSAGVILYVMLAGYLPFDDPTMKGLFSKISKGNFKFPKHFSPQAKALIKKMLVVDPRKRITISEIKEDPWCQVGLDKFSQKEGSISISEDQIKTAVNDTKEEVVSSESSTAASPIQPESFNAFELASRLMMGTLNPLVSSEQSVIRRETCFFAEPTDLMDKLIDLLKKLKADPKKKDDYELKCILHTTKGMLTFSVKIHPSVSKGLVMVEFRRGRGDVLKFNEFFRTVLDSKDF